MKTSNSPSSEANTVQVSLGSGQLTAREKEILNLLSQGYVTKEIACRLAISFDTVRFHLKNIYRKMSVRSRSEAVMKFMRDDWNRWFPGGPLPEVIKFF